MTNEDTRGESETMIEEPELADEAAVADELARESSDAPAVETASADVITPIPSAELRAIVEALIFASPEPITPKTLYKLLSNESKEAVSAAVNDLRTEYLNRPGLQFVDVAGGYQITTRPELHEWVRRLFHERSAQKLSVAALESLAVISYKQPVTALEVSEIRGVNTSGVLGTLIDRRLVKVAGRKRVVGRPFLYATTREFLIRFGLKDLTDLPKIEEMAEALGFDVPAALNQPNQPELVDLEPDEETEPVTSE